MAEIRIRFDGVSKYYGQHCVVDKLRLDIEKGEFVSLLGPSGSGKTTLLMMLAGFETATEGQILVDGYRVNDVPSHKRDMGVVFQNYALFPHMTIGANVAFPLQMRGMSKSEIAERVGKALDMVQLGALSERKPSQLSGGQQQRVALARALVFEPRVVLMDEPLGALDKNLREQMQFDIRALHQRLGLTIVFVTHDQGEALTMSDRIAVFNKGKIEQIGTPRQVYDEPATRFVAEFIGETNLIDGIVETPDPTSAAIRLKGGDLVRVAGAQGLAIGQGVSVSVRPERLALVEGSASVGQGNMIAATVDDCVYQGDHLRVQLSGPGGASYVARLDRKSPEPSRGAAVTALFSPEDCRVIAP
ncbi:ABC transporter ATP-binding protein [Neorhizobium sp. NCHU2750]|uniref:ABC transporter ATP-binding protein n=1 Tax=Neorhizobium sp. NCHU2750 TaxID=1825976 RepID=UPI000E71064D|nr:spermidine/putrescine ABC transporter ATP-binding protein [Neorhizobium sp. NCHU2750]